MNPCTTTETGVLRMWRCGPGAARSMASFQLSFSFTDDLHYRIDQRRRAAGVADCHSSAAE
jgi:hypothetical protein